jgi:putative transposase
VASQGRRGNLRTNKDFCGIRRTGSGAKAFPNHRELAAYAFGLENGYRHCVAHSGGATRSSLRLNNESVARHASRRTPQSFALFTALGAVTFAKTCRWLRLQHKRTHPYTPRTNGKAERFIQTLLRQWAYRRAYPNSGLRNAALPRWLHRYNHLRPHASLGRKPPVSRLASKVGEQRP